MTYQKPVGSYHGSSLYAASRGGSKTAGKFVGTRRLPNGEIEKRTFEGLTKDVYTRWHAWVDSPVTVMPRKGREAAEPGKDKEEDMANAQAQAKVPGMVYVLRFSEGRKTKVLGAFLREEDAIAQADMLMDALKVAEVDGTYEVDAVRVWS